MKHSLFITALLVILFSCKKEITQDQSSNSLLTKIKIQLKDSLAESDFQQLDFNHAVISKFEKNDLSILRIAFNNKSIATDFILLKIAKNGLFSNGRIINLTGNKTEGSGKLIQQFNGKINISSLNRNLLTSSRIINGYVEAFHPKPGNARYKPTGVEVVEVPLMAEVVVYASYPSNNGWNYSTWYNMHSFFNDFDGGGGGSGGSGYYSNSNPFDSWGGGSSSGGSGEPINDEPVVIDFEPTENIQPIDIKKYLKCFSSIPDDGAICTIKIFTDLPVDKDPNAFFNWDLGSPGHTFLQIRKTNGTESAQQNIGFYPEQGWKTVLTPAPIDGKFADNDGHEFNASMSMELTPEQLKSTLIHIEYLANFIKYDIDDYNCTDFALEVFNYKRGGNHLTIPMFNIPGGMAPNGTTTPQGLYQRLKAMRDQGGNESNNIIIPGVKGYAGTSKGLCN